MTQEEIKEGMIVWSNDRSAFYKVLLVDVMLDTVKLVVMEKMYTLPPKKIIAHSKEYFVNHYHLYRYD